MKRSIVLLIFLLIFSGLKAQVDTLLSIDKIIENTIENYVQSTGQEVDYTQLYDRLYRFYRHKINLNYVSRDTLAELFFLSDNLVDAFMRYRRRYGPLLSVYELRAVPGFTDDIINMMLPFVYVWPRRQVRPMKLKYAFKYGRSEMFLRDQFVVQQQKGYIIRDTISPLDTTTNRYLGNRQKIYFRYRFRYSNRLDIGLTAEKDAGEQFFAGAQKYGFDFYSFHLKIGQLSKHLQQVIIGDFRGQFGQGLVLWNGFGFGKSAMVLDVRKRQLGLTPYGSTDENKFFRGIGLQAGFGNFVISGFASYKYIDGSIVSVNDTAENQIDYYFTSLEGSGYHRTFSEIKTRHTVAEAVTGANITYLGDNVHLGLTFIGYDYSVPFRQKPTIYRQDVISLNSGANVGFNYFYVGDKADWWGEFAYSTTRDWAAIAGTVLKIYYRLQAVMVWRYFGPRYFAFYSNAFSESTLAQNEMGFYTGLQLLPIRNWKISLYFDTYRFPDMRFRIYEPQTFGNDVFVQVDYTPSFSTHLYMRYRTEIKPQNYAEQSAILQIRPKLVRYFRVNLSTKLNSVIGLNSRLELSYYRQGQTVERGSMLYQDLILHLRHDWALFFRLAAFDAPYDARIYAYENDLLYAFSIPAYFYKGIRFYALARYKMNNHLTFWVKYGQFTYTDRDVISAGSLNEIIGPTKSEVKIQVRWRF